MEQIDNEILNTEHTYNLFYGLLDNELKHISEVKNGLKCDCICPACEKKLVARNGGQKRIHHFAHYESAECKYGVQTSIHIAAKNILERVKKIRVPAVTVFVNTEIEKTRFEFISHGQFEKVSAERYIEFQEVILEKKLHKYIPDVVLISKGKRLIVEIAVTHFVGRKKLDKIIKSKISAVEIDLSKIENDFKMEELEPLIIDNLENKTWLHNQYGLEQKERKRLELLAEIHKKNEKERLRIEKEEQKKREREIWYKKYYKEIVYRKVGEDYTVKQIENCPLKKRQYQGQFYASVNSDCSECEHSRWERQDGKYLVCLYEYHKLKGQTE